VITLEEELERLELYMSLESIRFKDRFNYEVDTNGVDVESVLIPPMIMQPFVENSIIHGILPNESKLGLIRIVVEKKDGFLLITIEDNGVGINQSMDSKSGSDGDHRSQGMEITSKRIELIQKISNNHISLEGPYEIQGSDGSINGTRVLIKIPLSDLDI
jgi:sensor histidine kinase YesM